MSRIAKEPVELPKGVEFKQDGNVVTVRGGKGSLSLELNSEVQLSQEENTLLVAARSGSRFAAAMSGTTRSLLANMVHGVSEGFVRKLELVGVGYRAQAQGNKLNLTLGFSHPVVYDVPEGVTVKRRAKQKFSLQGLTNRRLVRLRPRSDASVRQSPTRARVFGTQMSVLCAKKRRRSSLARRL